LCGGEIAYLGSDLRPVFPEERLLVEILLGKPLCFKGKAVWACDNRYYIDGKAKAIALSKYAEADVKSISAELKQHSEDTSDEAFDESIARFCAANKGRFDKTTSEAMEFINDISSDYPEENIVISFSGGKDSTAVADLVIRALGNPTLVHVFGNTTLEFESTLEYANRYRNDNLLAIFKTAMNSEQDFYAVADEIGPPARMMRWCCSMFKTGPITRVFNGLYRNRDILTFYGIRKCESVTRSRYNRVEDDAESVKIQKQKVASPIFFWRDIDVWLYILTRKLDFNHAYRLGYDRVGCWCCPNNNPRAQFLSSIYMSELSKEWRSFLVEFAKRIGKQDPEVYVDTGKWKARQGGNGLTAAKSVKLRYSNCATEEHAVVFSLDRPYSAELESYFCPIGKLAPELGRSLIRETVIIDPATNTPALSIQPFVQSDYDNAIKIKVLDATRETELLRMSKYQVTKYNACRQCLKCESLCKYGAISIISGEYHIDPNRCRHCRQCVTDKYLEGGCLMRKYLRTKEST
jgi:phosphoadenosine phosphosulfate reductase